MQINSAVFKRFLKGLGAALVAAGVSFIASNVANLNLSPAAQAVVAALALALEKSFTPNL